MVLTFLVASFVLAVTPGPGVFYVLTRTLAQGRRAGLVSVASVACGNLGNAVAASIGLFALFAMSSWSFVVVRYAGAAYLIYLGVSACLVKNDNHDLNIFAKQTDAQIFREGFWVALLNPKTTVFYAAFLPQFIQSNDQVVLKTALLGFVFVAIASMTDACYVLVADKFSPDFLSLARGRRLSRYVTASAFVALGLFTAFVDFTF